MRLNGLFVASFISLCLLSFSAKSELITFEVTAEEFVQQQRITTYDLVNNTSDTQTTPPTFTSIVPNDFNLSWDVDINSALFGMPNTSVPEAIGFADSYTRDGKLYSLWLSAYTANVTGDTPFTNTLKNDFLPITNNPYFYSEIQGLSYYSIVVSDIASGDIVESESFESIRLYDTTAYRNTENGMHFSHVIQFDLDLGTTFTSAVNTILTGAELLDIVLTSSNEIVYNEIATISSLNNTLDIRTSNINAYVGRINSVSVVPEASTLSLFLLSSIALLRLQR
jgi:hypothetical protein